MFDIQVHKETTFLKKSEGWKEQQEYDRRLKTYRLQLTYSISLPAVNIKSSLDYKFRSWALKASDKAALCLRAIEEMDSCVTHSEN